MQCQVNRYFKYALIVEIDYHKNVKDTKLYDASIL